MHLKTRVTCRDLGAAGALVRLPRVFWLYLEFRRTFRQARQARQAWSWIVPGPCAMGRLGTFDRLHGEKAAADLRRREQARRDAEWDAAERADPPLRKVA